MRSLYESLASKEVGRKQFTARGIHENLADKALQQ